MNLRSFIAPKYIEHEIETANGKSIFRFYPASVGKLFFMRSLSKSLISNLHYLFTTNPYSDFDRTTRQFQDGNESTMRPLTEVMEKRAVMNREAIERIIDCLLHEDNLKVIAEIIIDSLRDVTPKMTAEEFVQEVDVTVLPDFLMGVAKANKKLFGPFGEALTKAMNLFRQRLNEKLNPPPEAADDFNRSSNKVQEEEEVTMK